MLLIAFVVFFGLILAWLMAPTSPRESTPTKVLVSLPSDATVAA
jgi:hypothetical protein